MWIYLVGFLVAVLAFYWYQLDMNVLKLHVTVQEAALHAATWGCVRRYYEGFGTSRIGSATENTETLRIYFISVPFLGALFGAILYFLVVAGLFIIAPTQAAPILSNQTSLSSSANSTTTNTANQPNPSSTPVVRPSQISTLAIIPLATLAGFNCEWAVTIFKRIGDSFKTETEVEDKIGK
jgi:hypothetical protein